MISQEHLPWSYYWPRHLKTKRIAYEDGFCLAKGAAAKKKQDRDDGPEAGSVGSSQAIGQVGWTYDGAEDLAPKVAFVGPKTKV